MRFPMSCSGGEAGLPVGGSRRPRVAFSATSGHSDVIGWEPSTASDVDFGELCRSERSAHSRSEKLQWHVLADGHCITR